MQIVPRVPPFDRRATYEDLVQLPDHLVGEILDGELHANSRRPAPRLAGSAMALHGMLVRALGRGGSDSWQILPEPELHLGADILVPALAGWRGSRLPGLPDTPYFSLPPDWVCEVVSPGATASFRARKMAIYASEGVPRAWLIDPVARTVEARRLEHGRWTSVATHHGDEIAGLEPFEGIDLPLARLWGN